MKYKLDKDQIIKNFLPKIKVVAYNLSINLPDCVEIDDLIQEGVIGLLQAYDRYNEKYGTTFYTFALSRIKGSMLDYLRKIDWLPKEIRHLIKIYEAFISENQDKYFKDEEIAEKLNISLKDVKKIKFSISKSQILELDYYFEAGTEDVFFKNEKAQDPEIMAYKDLLKERLEKEILTLKEKEQLLLSLYYEKNLNFKEIGVVLGVSESRISQIHSAVLLKLKKKLKADD